MKKIGYALLTLLGTKGFEHKTDEKSNRIAAAMCLVVVIVFLGVVICFGSDNTHRNFLDAPDIEFVGQ